MVEYVLLSDISNGEYLKLALAPKGERPSVSAHFECEGLEGFKAAIDGFLQEQGRPALAGAAISAAGWERGGVVHLPNHGFSIDRSDIRAFLGTQRVNLVNDFVAKALAVPRLHEEEKIRITGTEPVDDQMVAVIGPHHGLGVAGLVPDGMGNWTAMPSEGGHSDLAATNDIEAAVLAELVKKYGHVSRERVVSIPGVIDIWHTLARLAGEAPKPGTIHDVVALARAGDARARQAINLSMGWFAALASDTGLMLGALGGIYLAGDLLDILGDLFDTDTFVQRYGDKGRLSGYVSDIPVFNVVAQDMELIGLATLF